MYKRNIKTNIVGTVLIVGLAACVEITDTPTDTSESEGTETTVKVPVAKDSAPKENAEIEPIIGTEGDDDLTGTAKKGRNFRWKPETTRLRALRVTTS